MLDASAPLARLRHEYGGERVEITARAPSAAAAAALEVAPFDDAGARETARLRAKTRSLRLSPADLATLALAKSRGIPMLTADRAWRSLRLPIKIEVIR